MQKNKQKYNCSSDKTHLVENVMYCSLKQLLNLKELNTVVQLEQTDPSRPGVS